MIRTKSAILVVPGINFESGDALVHSVSAYLKDADFDFFLFDLWKSAGSLETLSLRRIHDALDGFCSHIKEQGHEQVIGLGKSFGGGVLLSSPNDIFSKLLLVAPAISYTDSDFGSVRDLFDETLRGIPSVLSISIGKKDLEQIAVPVEILHGTADQIVSIDNSVNICRALSDCSLMQVPQMEHSLSPDDYKRIAEILVSNTSNGSI